MIITPTASNKGSWPVCDTSRTVEVLRKLSSSGGGGGVTSALLCILSSGIRIVREDITKSTPQNLKKKNQKTNEKQKSKMKME